ncbi:MAG TPA: RsmB/NOP family class I SAM-dependent RNA methyltransferase, partial [Polyangiales bacterium]|nr:RsmB/NOP family class I SAM-dependent RNA methyltransferase [Polyangiales bacterium]
GVSVRRGGASRALPGYAQGHFSVQEEGAQLVALALGAREGERIADVCSGHGGKTTLLASQVGARGHVTAIDLDERKLEHIAPELDRLGIARERVDTQAIDVSVGTGGLGAAFDRVLVDAPCSGLGTIHRRPELLLRLGPKDPARLAELQLRILLRAAELVRPEGLLAYAVCSPTRVEAAEVASRFEAAMPRARRLLQPATPAFAAEHAWAAPDADGILRIGPWQVPPGAAGAPDGYQLVLFRM